MRSGLHARLFARSILLQAGFSDERRQGLGFAWSIDPALSSAYVGDAAGLSAARARHLAPFNSQPHAAGLLVGLAAGLEARAAAGESGLAERAVALKSSLSAALSGSADAFFWGALRPLAGASAVLAAALGVRFGAAHPFVWGASLGLAVFNAPGLWARWTGTGRGLSDGEAAAAAAARLPVRSWVRGARIAAVLAVFAGAWAVLSLSLGASPAFAATAFAAGAGLGRYAGSPLRLVLAAGILGAAASAAGWTI